MNNYAGQTVTVSGDVVHSRAALKTVASDNKSAAVPGQRRAMDLMVDCETGQK